SGPSTSALGPKPDLGASSQVGLFRSAGVSRTIGNAMREGCHGDHENDCRSDGPTLLAIGIAILINAGHFPEMAKQIDNDPGLIFVSGILRFCASSCTLSGFADKLLGDAARKARDRRRLEGVVWIGGPTPGR